MRINGRSAEGIRQSLGQANKRSNASLEKLATGTRIRGAADDASGLIRSEELRALIQSFDAASRNLGDGISLTRTADSALDEIGSSVGRMRELALQAGNGTLNAADRANLASEFTQLSEHVDQVAAGAQFNGNKLLDGSAANIHIQAGPAGDSKVELELFDATSGGLGLGSVDLTSEGGARASLEAIDAALEEVSSARAGFGAAERQLETNLRQNVGVRDNLQASESRIRDVDYALESARQVQASILQQGAASIYTQASVSSLSALQLL